MAVETVIRTIRHAQSVYSPDQRYAGSTDVALSEQGERDCACVAEPLRDVSVDVVVTSTKRRAIETARLLGFEPDAFVRTPLCDERCYGELEGHTWAEAVAFEPPLLFIEVGGDLHSVNPPGGEPFEDVWRRALLFRDFLLDRYAGGSVLVVSHGVFLQMFHGVLRGSTCIESLAYYPATLELATFRLLDGALVEETEVRSDCVTGEGY